MPHVDAGADLAPDRLFRHRRLRGRQRQRTCKAAQRRGPQGLLAALSRCALVASEEAKVAQRRVQQARATQAAAERGATALRRLLQGTWGSLGGRCSPGRVTQQLTLTVDAIARSQATGLRRRYFHRMQAAVLRRRRAVVVSSALSRAADESTRRRAFDFLRENTALSQLTEATRQRLDAEQLCESLESEARQVRHDLAALRASYLPPDVCRTCLQPYSEQRFCSVTGALHKRPTDAYDEMLKRKLSLLAREELEKNFEQSIVWGSQCSASDSRGRRWSVFTEDNPPIGRIPTVALREAAAGGRHASELEGSAEVSSSDSPRPQQLGTMPTQVSDGPARGVGARKTTMPLTPPIAPVIGARAPPLRCAPLRRLSNDSHNPLATPVTQEPPLGLFAPQRIPRPLEESPSSPNSEYGGKRNGQKSPNLNLYQLGASRDDLFRGESGDLGTPVQSPGQKMGFGAAAGDDHARGGLRRVSLGCSSTGSPNFSASLNFRGPASPPKHRRESSRQELWRSGDTVQMRQWLTRVGSLELAKNAEFVVEEGSDGCSESNESPRSSHRRKSTAAVGGGMRKGTMPHDPSLQPVGEEGGGELKRRSTLPMSEGEQRTGTGEEGDQPKNDSIPRAPTCPMGGLAGAGGAGLPASAAAVLPPSVWIGGDDPKSVSTQPLDASAVGSNTANIGSPGLARSCGSSSVEQHEHYRSKQRLIDMSPAHSGLSGGQVSGLDGRDSWGGGGRPGAHSPVSPCSAEIEDRDAVLAAAEAILQMGQQSPPSNARRPPVRAGPALAAAAAAASPVGSEPDLDTTGNRQNSPHASTSATCPLSMGNSRRENPVSATTEALITALLDRPLSDLQRRYPIFRERIASSTRTETFLQSAWGPAAPREVRDILASFGEGGVFNEVEPVHDVQLDTLSSMPVPSSISSA
eukprot:Hpha_TRINITY_DN15364_c4_g1::TRINITY_DN15364_c4_g1_i1::g.91239::m.91239